MDNNRKRHVFGTPKNKANTDCGDLSDTKGQMRTLPILIDIVFTKALHSFIDLLKPFIEEAIDNAISRLPATTSDKTPDSLLTVKQVAVLLNVSQVTIHNWKAAGYLPFHRKGRRVLFKRSEIFSSFNASPK